MTFRRTFTALLAASAIAAPVASAQPADMHDWLAKAQPHHQQRVLPSPDAADAALHPRSASLLVVASPGHPSEAANATVLPPQTEKALSESSGGGIDWITVALGSAGLLLFLGGVVALATRTRPAPGTRISI